MNMRIGGLASGIDIDNIVSELMKAERMKVDKVWQNRQVLQWRQESYNELNRTLANFILTTKSAFGLNQTTSTGTIAGNAFNNLTWVKNATVSDSDVTGVSVNAAAASGTYNINVRRLAENRSLASGEAVSSADAGNLASYLSLNDTDTIRFTIYSNSDEITINKTNLSNVSMKEIVDEINAANIGVTAIFDEELDRFFLQTDKTGEENSIRIVDESVLAGGVKFLTGANNKMKLKYLDDEHNLHDVSDNTTYAGKDALIDFGAATGIAKSSNTFTINNITFTLKSTGSASVTVNSDVNAVYEKIKGFVASYNELLDTIGSKLNEKRYSDYLPLTDEQKENMTEAQIEKWEKMAKSGLLRNDSTVERVIQRIREGLYAKVSGITGIFEHLSKIGINTEGYASGSRGGKLVIDEVALKAAIEKDVDSVMELLFKEPGKALRIKPESQMSGAEITQKRNESGLIGRLYDNIITGMKEIINKAGAGENAELYSSVSSTILVDFIVKHGSISMLDTDIDGLTDRINNLNDYLARTEERYWSKFTAMEKAVQRMNEQSAWLAQQFFNTWNNR